MKQIVQKIWMVIATLCATLSVSAFTVDGIQYEILTSSSVCALNADDCMGTDIIIPEMVIDNDKTYNVVSIGPNFKSGNVHWEDGFVVGERKRLYIPKSVVRIEEYGDYGIFHYFENLFDIVVDKENPMYVSINGGLLYKDLSSFLRYPPCNTTTKYVIPNGVEEIYESAFKDNYYLECVEMPNSLKHIRQRGFSCCEALNEVIWSSQLEVIERDAFYCTNIKEARLPASLKSLAGLAFDSFQTMQIYCEGTTPATIVAYKGTYQPFNDKTLKNGILYVPFGSINTYRKSAYWRDFNNIEEYEVSSTAPEEISQHATITFLDKLGSIIKNEEISLKLPIPEQIEGYSFVKWIILAGDLDNGIQIQALYEENPISSRNIIGNEESNSLNKKVIKSGQVYIYKGGKMYNTHGIELQMKD